MAKKHLESVRPPDTEAAAYQPNAANFFIDCGFSPQRDSPPPPKTGGLLVEVNGSETPAAA